MSILFEGMSQEERDFFHKNLQPFNYNMVGRFGLKVAPHVWFYLVDTHDYAWACKDNEIIFRYFTRATVAAGDMAPLVKINIKKKLVYFLTEACQEGWADELQFERRGEKAAWLILKEGDKINHYK
jgi:hypothetical protein